MGFTPKTRQYRTAESNSIPASGLVRDRWISRERLAPLLPARRSISLADVPERRRRCAKRAPTEAGGGCFMTTQDTLDFLGSQDRIHRPLADYRGNRQARGVSTFLDRLEVVLAESGLSHREFARRAELGSDRQISVMLHRLRGGKEPNFEMDTLVKIAHAGRVRLEWLVSGEGEKRPSQEPRVEQIDRYPKRTQAIQRLRGVVSEQAISYVEGFNDYGSERRDEFFWVSQLYAAELLWRSKNADPQGFQQEQERHDEASRMETQARIDRMVQQRNKLGPEGFDPFSMPAPTKKSTG